MRLSLAHRNPACARVLPPCLTFEARSTPYSVVVMADAANRGKIWDPHVLTALRAINAPPSPHRTHHLPTVFSAQEPNSNTVRARPKCSQTKHFSHYVGPYYTTTAKRSTRRPRTRLSKHSPTVVRNLQKSNALQDIPALHPAQGTLVGTFLIPYVV